MNHNDYFAEYTAMANRKNSIPLELYKKFNTKRGLRNDDGTGVLVGLTEIGEVHGYIIDDQERVPDRGGLWYRGISIEDLVRGFQQDHRFGFAETVYLLLFGELPSATDLERLQDILGSLRRLPDNFTEDMILRAPSRDIMNKLARSVLAAYSYDERAEDHSVENVLRQVVELIARFPTMVAYGYQALRHYFHSESLYIHAPDPERSTAENLLAMVRHDQGFTHLEAETLDLALVLHAEHGGGNNSAFTIHVVSSADTDTYSAIAAAVGSLKGAKHGGAAGRVREMMADIQANIQDWTNEVEVKEYIRRIMRKEAFDRSGLVYGVGHAVYTLSDPRAVLLEEKARELAEESGHKEEYALYRLIAELTPTVFQEEKNTDRIIAPNVDFYSGFVYSMLGIPVELYTPIFAVSRIAGWAAHRLEEIVSGGRIIRPAYKNVMKHRQYLSMAERQ
jgi:citrate synthase